MKKLSLLLVAAMIVTSAAATVNQSKARRMASTRPEKVKVEIGDVNAHRSERYTRGSSQVLETTQLNDVKWHARTAKHMLRGENSITWDFEDEAQLEDWSIIDADGDGHCWGYINDPNVVSHSGTGVVASESFDNATLLPLTPDNWLVSPIVPLDGTLVFYAAGQDPSYAYEHFAVYAAVGEPSSIDDFVKISDDFMSLSSMKEFIVDLSAFEGQEGCIAIRHYNSTNQFLLNIDDVTITTEEVIPEPQPEAPEVITEVPERCTVKTYYRDSGTILYHWLIGIYARPTAGKFSIAFDPESNDVYIQNPVWAYQKLNVWVKGTIDPQTNIITIPTGQYLQWDPEFEYGLVLGCGSSYVYEEGVDPDTGEPAYVMDAEIDDRTTEFYLQLIGDEVYLLNTEGDIHDPFPLWGNTYGLMLYWSDNLTWEAIEFANRNQEDGSDKPFGTLANIVPAIPANPTADEFIDCGNESGYTKFYFTLPETDIDGNRIDFERVSYSVWVYNDDGPELYVFDEETYIADLEGLGDLTEIPYEVFYAGYDFFDYMVYIHRTNAPGFTPLFTQNIGIQAHYTVDGVKNSSDVVWFYDQHSGTSEINAGKTVASVRYYNVTGQEMAQPSGMTIQVTTYTDGTTSATKVVK